MLQVVTGILLALIYVPSAGEAWNSLQILNHSISLGWFIRALHGWGSNFMIAIVLVHMAQVFLFGAYKYPRELTWILGVFLLLMTLGMGFTGQVLRFDQDAYWGLGIGASIVSRVPLIGPSLVTLVLGGPTIAGATLSRFFAHACIRDPRTPDRLRRATCPAGAETGNQRVADARARRSPRDLSAGLSKHWCIRRASRSCQTRFGRTSSFPASSCLRSAPARLLRALRTGRAAGPDDHSDRSAPRFLLPVALCRALVPSAGRRKRPLLLIGPVIAIALLLGLPFFAGEGEKSWRRRPVAVLTISAHGGGARGPDAVWACTRPGVR